VIEVVAGDGWSDAHASALKKQLLEVDRGFTVEVKRVGALPVAPDGRRRAVVSAAPITWESPAPEPASSRQG
jgi:hypothetical protein